MVPMVTRSDIDSPRSDIFDIGPQVWYFLISDRYHIWILSSPDVTTTSLFEVHRFELFSLKWIYLCPSKMSWTFLGLRMHRPIAYASVQSSSHVLKHWKTDLTRTKQNLIVRFLKHKRWNNAEIDKSIIKNTYSITAANKASIGLQPPSRSCKE